MRSIEYMRGISFIALNDEPGSSEAMNVVHVRNQISVVLMAEVFKVPPKEIAMDVIYRRLEHNRPRPRLKP